MKKSIRFISVLLVLTMVMGMMGCQSAPAASSSAPAAPGSTPASAAEPAASEGIKIGVITLNMEAQFWLDIVAGVRSVVEPKGGTVTHYSSENDVQRAVQQVEDMITQKFDFIALTCVDKQGLYPALRSAHDAGVPVIIYDKMTDDADLVLTQIQTNDYEIGFYMANLMAEMLEYKGKVMSVTTPSVSVSSRNDGFAAAIEQYPDMELVMGEAANALSDTTLPVVEGILQMNPDVKGWLGISETQSMGAISAIEGAGKLDDILVVDLSASPTTLEFIREGKVDVTLDQQAYETGVLIAESAYRHLAGETVEPYIQVPWLVVTEDNLEEYEAMLAARS